MMGCKIIIIEPPAELPEKGDIADLNAEGWGAEQIRSVIEATEEKFLRFKFVRADKLQMRKPSYLIDRMIETDSTGQIFADVESYKTFIIVEMSCCVATGTPFFGLPVRRGPAIMIVGEGGGGLTRRIGGWSIAREVSLEGRPLFVSAQSAAMTEGACLQQIIEAVDLIVARHGPIELLSIDTLSRNFGAGSENDSEAMNAYVVNTNALRERYRCAVISVHHPGQAAKDRSRGHYAFIGSLDFSYRCEKDETGTMRFECQKMKDAEHPAPMAFRFAEVALGIKDDEGREVTSGVLARVAYEPPARKGTTGRGKWQTSALETLETELLRHRKDVEASGRDPDTARVSVADWREACIKAGMPKNRFYDVRRTLRDDGLIHEEYGFVDIL